MRFRLIVVRHGSTQWNRERRYQGCVDTRPSEEGQVQAEATARVLAHRQLAAVYASPLARAQGTATAVATRHGLPVLTIPAFREICMGRWEGQTVSEIETRWPEQYAVWRECPDTAVIPEGESLAEAHRRVLEGLGRLRAAHEGETICVVSHGVTIRLLILEALGLPPERLWSIQVKSAGISELEYRDGWTAVNRMNILSHLDELAEGWRL